ncbi:MAG: type II secretion system GspH family protein [Candidatus Gastranaerophilales bacterium]|nr:type II secretion system GspH family protein [Candidatus Gastranaerophilales bacterium]
MTNLFKRNIKLKAFTLAETLITLVIIGIIAAITVPTIISNYVEQATVSKVKKFYSTMSNAINLAIVKNGSVSAWDLESESGSFDSASAIKFANYIKPYLNVMVDCKTDVPNSCMEKEIEYTALNGTTPSSIGKYASSTSFYRMILADGSLIWFRTNGNGCKNKSGSNSVNICAEIWFDINGNDKKPNKLGIDTFDTKVKARGLVPNEDDNDCYTSGHGWTCLRYILENSNMNYPSSK